MSVSDTGYALHLNPAWRAKANFIIDAYIDKEKTQFEQLWVRRLEGTETQFELCTIPAFLYDLALGDILETSGLGEEHLIVSKVAHRNGHHAFRVWFGESTDEQKNSAINDIKMMSPIDLELYSDNLLLIDVPNSKSARKIQNYLDDKDKNESLVFENVDKTIDF